MKREAPLKEHTLVPKVDAYKSKTLWAVIANWLVVKYVPGASEWISKHTDEYAEVLGVLLILLRNFTVGVINWKFWKKSTLLKIKEDQEKTNGHDRPDIEDRL